MKIEIRTSEYNTRRYSKPWIAKVTFDSSNKSVFDWGAWIGDPGEAGLLIIDAEEGDIVARGQKDFRKPKNSTPDYYQVREGNLVALDGKAEAYKLYTSQN